MDYLVATHNKGKRDELVRILSPLGIHVFLPNEKDIILSEPVEDADSFEGNALIKAKAGCRESGMPCIADDSGLCVDALDGRPGVFTARYHGESTPYREKMEFLLDEMKNVPDEKRTARFVCAAACVFPDGREVTVLGTCEGKIGYAVVGDKGFGFDPVFEYGGRSFAELSDSEKDAVSHRGNALKKLSAELAKIM